MVTSLNILITVLWFVSAVVDYNEFIYIWQLKEYRIDRFRDFLSTKSGQMYWQRYSILWRTVLVIVALLWPINSVSELKYLLIFILSIDFLKNIWLFIKHKLRHPEFTKKSLLLITLCVATEVIIFFLLRDWVLPFLFLVLRFFIASLIVQMLYLPTLFVRKIYASWAAKKLSSYKNLTVIGVTGSYGKSTVKHFLSQILSTQFKVATTPKNTNTEIGVAKFILNTDLTNVDIFVVEMGAYKMGEINKICEMVKPKIGVITGINEQHLSLFGSQKNIQKAKFELVASLPLDGLAVLNGDSPKIREKSGEFKVETRFYGADYETQNYLKIESTKFKNSELLATYTIEGTSHSFKTNLLGTHNALNISACIIIGRYLDMSFENLEDAILKLESHPKNLKLLNYGSCRILDDSYNSNQNGFMSALDVMANLSNDDDRKIVITRGIPELGKMSNLIHERIGGEIAFLADELIIITEDCEDSLRKGVGGKSNIKVRKIKEPDNLLQYVRSKKASKCVILIENRIPDVVYREISGENSI